VRAPSGAGPGWKQSVPPAKGRPCLWSMSAGNKSSFFQLHTVVKLFFNDIIIFQTRHR